MTRLYTLVTLTLLAGASTASYIPDWPDQPVGESAHVLDRKGVDQEVHGLQIDLPISQHLRNKAGTDGSGLCVFASGDMAARWHQIKPLIGMLEYMTHQPGGGYPDKVEKVVQKMYPGYHGLVQAEGLQNCVPLLDWAMKTNRIVCITYGYGERYGQRIAHMVILLHLDDQKAVILDNNFPGTYETMSRMELLRRMDLTMGGGGGGAWCYIFKEPPPPPVPVN